MRNKVLQARVLTVFIAAMMVVFNVFNVSSNYQSLMLIWGIASWSLLLSLAFAAVDFAGLSRLAMPDMRVMEQHHIMLAFAWFLSACTDVYLSYVVISTNMVLSAANNVLVQQGIVSLQAYTDYIPKGIALLLLTIQCLLEWELNKGIGILVEARRHKKEEKDEEKPKYMPQHRPEF